MNLVAHSRTSARIATYLVGKVHALPEGEELCSAHIIYTTSTLMLAGFQTNNNKQSMPHVTLDLSALASGLVKNRPQARAYKSNVTRGDIH